MPFQSGRVTFCRFRVEGDAPTAVDDTTLATLADHSFQETEIGAPDEVESGWTTGDHLFDTQFTYEKNGYGDMLLFALRIDTHKVPADVKRAYKRINEQAALQGTDNPTGFLSKREKRDAADLAGRQVHEDLATGKYRKSKAVPVLWDLPRGVIYCGAAGNTITEQLDKLMMDSFNVNLSPLTAGVIAGEHLHNKGRLRDYEDARPTTFTDPPSNASADHENASGPRDINIPSCPWTATSIDTKDFLGNEFLIWLWRALEADEGIVETTIDKRKSEIAVVIDKSLDMECAWEVTGKQTLRGDGPTRLPEAGDALATGKWPRKAGLMLADVTGGENWELTLQGDRMMIAGASLPEIADATGPRELIEARLLLTRQLADVVDGLYKAFLDQRFSPAWEGKRDTLRKWITSRAK